ncbi:adapter molecule Crk-like [Culicoides brevitarsis]|uniref:adapter molecule Crk-like n=1 Tax=Culicoides brevitarsis TaxID=469753 RepID=UPI00307CA780
MSFDVHNTESYFIENIDRTEAENLLNENEIGTFLVRPSANQGDLALSIKEPTKIGHYLIQQRVSANTAQYTIGHHSFPGMAELLTFYKLHYVGEAPLIRPIKSKDDFVNNNNNDETGNQSQDLPSPRLAKVVIPRVASAYDEKQLDLVKDEIIEVTKTNVNGYWEGKRLSNGSIGMFPFNHVKFIDEI